AAAAQSRSGISIVTGARLVVIHNSVVATLVPNLDAELVNAPSTTDISIQRCKCEAVVATAVHRPCSSELRLGACHHQPLIATAIEAEIASLKLEFCLTSWHRSSALIFANEPQIGFPRQRRIGDKSTRRRIDPAAACDKTAIGVVNNDQHVKPAKLPCC